jgi:Arc/MetJ-type ribon-helix-helix transcriptional regulator
MGPEVRFAAPPLHSRPLVHRSRAFVLARAAITCETTPVPNAPVRGERSDLSAPSRVTLPRTVRIAPCYAQRMAQVVTRLDDRLMAEVDLLVADGVVATRSEAVRLGLERLVDEHQRRRVGAEIVAAYRRLPQTDDELAGLDEATRALIREEPW